MNFGIVTRFDLVTFNQGEIWGNALSFPGSSNASAISLFQSLIIHGLPLDKGASGFVSINYHSSSSGYTTDVGLVHATVPSSLESILAVFEPFQKISSATTNSTVTVTVSTFIKSIRPPVDVGQCCRFCFLFRQIPYRSHVSLRKSQYCLASE